MIENTNDMSAYRPGGTKYGLVCEHGRLERKCDDCWNTARIRELEAELARRHDYDAVVNSLKACVETRKFVDKQLEQYEEALRALGMIDAMPRASTITTLAACAMLDEARAIASAALARAGKETP